jgi:hypothetical protein
MRATMSARLASLSVTMAAAFRAEVETACR